MAAATTSAPQQQVAMPALDLRRYLGSLISTEGVRTSSDLAVSQRAAGANMSVDVAAGTAVIQDDHASGGGFYHGVWTATENLVITAAHATLPRVDRIVALVKDMHLGDASNAVELAVIDGTPTAGATLSNLNGAAAVPSSALLLANVLVAAADTSITNAEIDTTVRMVVTLSGTGGSDPVTSLPASPFDRQQVLLVDDVTAPTYAWLMQYESGIADANKWVFLGGSPASSEVATSEARNSAAYGDTATVHSLTLPRAGVYEFEYGFRGEVDTGENNAQYMSPKYGAAEAVDGDAVIVTNVVGVAGQHFWVASRRKRFTVAAASQVVTMRYRQGTAHASSPVSDRWLKVLPVRVA